MEKDLSITGAESFVQLLSPARNQSFFSGLLSVKTKVFPKNT